MQRTLLRHTFGILLLTSAIAFAQNVEPEVRVLNPLILLADYSACGGQGAALSPAEMEALLFGRDSSTPTLEAQFRYCSHGKVQFGQRQVVVVPMTDCTDFTPPSSAGNIDASCPAGVPSFVSRLEEQARAQGLDTGPFSERWAVLDKSQQFGPGCFYAGLASQGPEALADGVPARRLIITSWPEGLMNVQNWMHEAGHNLRLQHSASVTGPYSVNGQFTEYGDVSCAMGGSGADQQPRCFNFAQAAMLHWIKPQFAFEVDSLANQWAFFPLSRPSDTDCAGVQIMHGAGPLRRNWFISFRKKSTKYRDLVTGTNSPFPNDLGMDAALAVQVLVHLVDGEYESMQPKPRSTLTAALQYRQQYEETRTPVPFVIRFDGYTSTGDPTVMFCRKAGPADCT